MRWRATLKCSTRQWMTAKHIPISRSDSAFPVSGLMEGRIETPLKDGDLEKIESQWRYPAKCKSNAIISIRQAAEWGMHSSSQTWQQLELKLPYIPDVRSRELSNIFRLHNLRERCTGISQIRSPFSPFWDENVSVIS
jgi:hypothetical protein